MENEEKKQSSLLGKRYKPFKGGYSVTTEEKEMVVKIKKDEDIQNVMNIICNGWVYSYQAIENDLYEELKADWDKLFHLLLLKKINGSTAMIEMMKSINSRFDKDKEYVI